MSTKPMMEEYDEFDEEPVELLSLDDAETRCRELVTEIQAIQAQLGDHGIDDATGDYRMGLADWEAWRRRAKGALKHKVHELQEVKAWIKHHEQSHARLKPLSEMTTGELAQAIHNMADELARRVKESDGGKASGALCSPTYDRQPFDD